MGDVPELGAFGVAEVETQPFPLAVDSLETVGQCLFVLQADAVLGIGSQAVFQLADFLIDGRRLTIQCLLLIGQCPDTFFGFFSRACC